MARCRECNGKVWRSAEYCEHCGVRYPAKGFPIEAEKSPPRLSRLLGIVLLVIVILVIIKASGTGSNEPASPCRSDWSRCTDNADLVNNYSQIDHAQFDCKREAAQRAKYGDPKFLSLYYFSTFYKGDQYPKTGKATLVEKDAQFQNAFGAMVHSEVTCIYDLRAKQVLSVEISPR
jgi:hypothetical protein